MRNPVLSGLRTAWLSVLALSLAACSGGVESDSGILDTGADAGQIADADTGTSVDVADLGAADVPSADAADTGPVVDASDGGVVDAADASDASADGGGDASFPDASDASLVDADDASADGGFDASSPDAGDASVDSGPGDASVDAGSIDSGPLPPPSEWTWSRGANFGDRVGASVWGGDRVFLPAEDRPFNPPRAAAMYWPEGDRFVDIPINHLVLYSAFVGWTGTHYLIGGGQDQQAYFALDDFAGYDPVTDRVVDFGSLPGGATAGLMVPFDGRAFFKGSCPGTIPVGTNPCFTAPSIFDPTTATWTAASTVGAPPSVSPPVGVWTGTEVIVFFGSSQAAARYNPVTDAWATMAQPSFTVGRGRVVWTGSEMFVWAGPGNSGLYNPSTNTWRTVSTVGAPAGSGVVAWTGSEAVVFGNVGAAHYNPLTDTWQPANAHNIYTAAPRSAMWTGDDVLLFTDSASYRYGPRQAGRAACDGSGSADLNARIARPVARRTAVGTVPLQVNINNNFSIVRLDWKVDGAVISSGIEDTNYDFSVLPIGPHTLTFEVEDALGNISCIDQAMDVGRAPVVNVVHPRDLDVASPNFTVEASCTDDTSCRLALRRNGSSLTAGPPGTQTWTDTLDFSADEGSEAVVHWEATDSLGFSSVSSDRTVLVRSNPALVRQEYMYGPPCDVDGTRGLYVNAAGDFALRDFSNGTEVVISVVGTADCARSFLVPAGGALLKAGSRVEYWNNGVLATWTAAAVAQAGNYAAFIVNSNGPVTLVDLNTLVAQTFGTSPYPGTLSLSSNGTSVWQNTSGVLYRRPLGTTSAVLATLPAPPPLPDPGMSNTRAVWRRPSGNQWIIDAFVNNAVVTLTGPHTYPAAANLNDEYAVSGDYVAYDAPDLTGVRQVWRVAPGGSASLMTGFSDATFLSGILDDGAVIYDRAGNNVHRSATGVVTDLGVAGTVHAEAGDRFYVQHGNVLFLVSP